MEDSRTKNSFLIMAASSVRQLLTVIASFTSRTVFIYVLGAEYLGLNGLFSNILQILSMSELGIGAAITFYLYKPIADNDVERIKGLMQFYKICYRVVGITMLVIGVVLIPFLKYIVNLETELPVNLYLVYFLYILNSSVSYLFFAYKQTLITAAQKFYKIERINIIFVFLNCIIDISILLIFKNFILYLVAKILMVLLKNLAVSCRADRMYPYLRDKNCARISKKEVKTIFGDVLSISMFRIGSTLYNSTDNIIISVMLGTIVVGYYSNYFMVISQISAILALLIRSFVAGIGNVLAKESKEKQYRVFREIDFILYFFSGFCSICLFQLLNSFIRLWVGNYDGRYVLSQITVAFLCLHFYMDGTCQVMNSFKEGAGCFKTGRELQILGGSTNIILSLVLGKYYGLEGIMAATVISKFFVTRIPFMIGVGRNVFQREWYELPLIYFKRGVITILITYIVWMVCSCFHMTNLGFFILECIFTFLVVIVLMIIFYRNTEEFKSLRSRVLSGVKNEYRKISEKIASK